MVVKQTILITTNLQNFTKRQKKKKEEKQHKTVVISISMSVHQFHSSIRMCLSICLLLFDANGFTLAYGVGVLCFIANFFLFFFS